MTGELNVIVEYCHFGNLRSYLLKHKDSFCDTMDDDLPPALNSKAIDLTDNSSPYKDTSTPYYVNKAGGPGGSADTVGPSLTTKNLICWAFQVARGMEYLCSKKVSCFSLFHFNTGFQWICRSHCSWTWSKYLSFTVIKACICCYLLSMLLLLFSQNSLFLFSLLSKWLSVKSPVWWIAVGCQPKRHVTCTSLGQNEHCGC